MCGLLRGALLELWEDNALPPPWILAIPADQPLPALLPRYNSCGSDTHTHTHRHTHSLDHKFNLTWLKHSVNNSGQGRETRWEARTKGLSQSMHGHTYCPAFVCVCVCVSVCTHVWDLQQVKFRSSHLSVLSAVTFLLPEVQQPPNENKYDPRTIVLFQDPWQMFSEWRV